MRRIMMVAALLTCAALPTFVHPARAATSVAPGCPAITLPATPSAPAVVNAQVEDPIAANGRIALRLLTSIVTTGATQSDAWAMLVVDDSGHTVRCIVTHGSRPTFTLGGSAHTFVMATSTTAVHPVTTLTACDAATVRVCRTRTIRDIYPGGMTLDDHGRLWLVEHVLIPANPHGVVPWPSIDHLVDFDARTLVPLGVNATISGVYQEGNVEYQLVVSGDRVAATTGTKFDRAHVVPIAAPAKVTRPELTGPIAAGPAGQFVGLGPQLSFKAGAQTIYYTAGLEVLPTQGAPRLLPVAGHLLVTHLASSPGGQIAYTGMAVQATSTLKATMHVIVRDLATGRVVRDTAVAQRVPDAIVGDAKRGSYLVTARVVNAATELVSGAQLIIVDARTGAVSDTALVGNLSGAAVDPTTGRMVVTTTVESAHQTSGGFWYSYISRLYSR